MILNYKHNKGKFFIPKIRCSVVKRESIFNKLDMALDTRLTIISAPAGSGKTTSVAAWIDSRELTKNTIWVSLDERYDNPEAFWNYLASAVVKPEDGVSNTDIPAESIIDFLLSNLSLIDEQLIFVMDDFHFIKNKDILMGMKHLIDGIEDNIHIIITTRTKPNINLARLRLNGEVTEIDRMELNFSLEEASEFLNNNNEFRIPEESIRELRDRTEGWIAGIQIALMSMDEKKYTDEFEKKFNGSNSYIQDYFSEEIFNNLSEDIKEFLLNTCILDELNSELCNAVSNRKNSQQILEQIYDMNLFIDKLDFHGETFRYYRLFKEFLIFKLSGINKEELHEARKRAAKWYEKNGFFNNAINQYIYAGNYEPIIKLIEDECIKKVLSNDYFYVMSWLENIPQDIKLKNPKFCLTYMYINIYDSISYNKYLDLARAALETCQDEAYKNECLGIISIIEGDRNLIEDEYKKSLDYYKNARIYLGSDQFWDLVLNLKAGVAYFYLQDATLEKESFDRAMDISQSYQDEVMNLVAYRTIIFTKILRGQLSECLNICNLALNSNVYDELKKTSIMSIFYIALALIHYENNEMDKAEDYVIKGIKMAEQQSSLDFHYYTLYIGYYVYAGILLQNNNKAKIQQVQDKSEELSGKFNDNKLADRYYFQKLRDYIEIFKMERYIDLGKINLVEKYIIKRDYKIVEELLMFSRVLMHKDKTEDALMLLNKILTSKKDDDNKYLNIRAYIFRAEIFSQDDQYENATKDLKEALIIGYKNGFVRLFLFKQIKMSKILLKTIRSMKFNKDYYKMGDYLNKVISLYSTEESGEIISKREKEVLMLIENGAKNSEIAKELFITESTAKSHILNIFSKLGVHNRVQAVAKAKEIGII